MDTIVKLNNQTAGRDKTARLLQYLSRFIWYKLHQNNKGAVNRFKNIEFQLSTFRKLLRLGKCVDVLYTTLPLFQHYDSTVRISLIMSKISNSLFLLADHILWLGRADIASINTDKWSKISHKYWLYSIIMNLVRDFYEIYTMVKLNKQMIFPKAGVKDVNDLYKSLIRFWVVLQHNRSIMIDTIRNGCDVFIPLAALGHVQLSPGTVGLLGVVSSIAGLMVLVDPILKLTPM